MEYEPRLMKLTNILVSKFAEYEGCSIEICQWFRCFVFDMMGELGFSKTYGCLENGTLHPAIQKIEDLLWVSTIFGQVPWLTSTLFKLPFLPNPLNDFKNFSRESLEKRKMVYVARSRGDGARALTIIPGNNTYSRCNVLRLRGQS
jgi:hypothetical protein